MDARRAARAVERSVQWSGEETARCPAPAGTGESPETLTHESSRARRVRRIEVCACRPRWCQQRRMCECQYGGGRLSVTCLVEGLYILHHGKLTAVGGRFLYARHLENVVFDLGGLPLRP